MNLLSKKNVFSCVAIVKVFIITVFIILFNFRMDELRVLVLGRHRIISSYKEIQHVMTQYISIEIVPGVESKNKSFSVTCPNIIECTYVKRQINKTMAISFNGSSKPTKYNPLQQ